MNWSHPALLQSLWDGLMIGVCLIDQAGKIVQMNMTGSRLLGWGAVCPQAVSFFDFLEQSEVDDGGSVPTHSLWTTLHEDKIAWLPCTRLRRRQGTWCWVELKGVALEDYGTTQFLMMFRDLTSETQLTEDYRRLASIPEESPFPIIEVDRDGHLLYANPSMVQLMEESNVGKDGFTTALPEHFPELAARCLVSGHLESNVEVQVGQKSYNWTFSSHPELGRLRGYGMDVTDSKRAAAELSEFTETLERKNQELDGALVKAEAATRAKAAFLATMSHEIRTPLNGVIGMAELLLNSNLDVEQQECTKIIRKSGEGLLEIINDILDFSKIESGHMTLETIAFNPLVLVEEVLDLFSERAHRKGLDIAAYIAPDIPRNFLGDPHRLRQILCNYISNALKFTSEGSILIEVVWLPGSELKGRVERLSIKNENASQSKPPARHVRFSVKDTGIGISQSVQKKIFQVFMQADSSMSRKYGGSGLGLAICQQLAELMNGIVGVDSQEGQGATFWCDLPFPVSDGSPVFSMDQYSCLNKVVVVCAPSNVSRDVLSRYLHDQGVKVICVEGVQDLAQVIQNLRESSKDFLGMIIGNFGHDQDGQSCLQLDDVALYSGLKIWGLLPFWVQKNTHVFPIPIDDIITMPIHQNQLCRCVFGEKSILAVDHGNVPEVSILKNWQESPNAQVSSVSAEPHSSENTHDGPSVLIVEDNLINQKVAEGLFRKLGCNVHVAESGEQALLLFQQIPIDLIMMDWELPDMDGIATAQAIRDLEGCDHGISRDVKNQAQSLVDFSLCRHLPIVGMTAHGYSERNETFWHHVMDDCLAKPVHLEDLALVLERWVGSSFQRKAREIGDSHERADAQVSKVCPEDNLGGVYSQTDSPGKSVPYDYRAALNALEGDEHLLHSLFEIFLDTWPVLNENMKEALAADDRVNFLRLAHQLKGALFALNASSQAHMVEQLEAEASMALLSEMRNSFEDMGESVTDFITLLEENLCRAKSGERKECKD